MNLPTDPVFYAVAGIAITLLGFAKGGFAGLGMASVPLLALVMEPMAAAAMLLPILIAQDSISVWAFRKNFDMRTLKLMLPGAVVGIFIGWWFSASVSTDAVRGLVGLISVLFGLYRLIGTERIGISPKRALPQWVGTFWGAVAGFTSHVAHAGGPPFQIWALTRNFPHTVFIGTSSIFFATLNVMKLPAYAALGQFTWANMQLTLVFLPIAILSTMAGVVFIKRVSPERFHLIINLLMILVGAELLRVSFF